MKLIAKFHHIWKWTPSWINTFSRTIHKSLGLETFLDIELSLKFHHSSCIRCSDLHIFPWSYHPRSTKHSANCFLSSIWQTMRRKCHYCSIKIWRLVRFDLNDGSMQSHFRFELCQPISGSFSLSAKSCSVFATSNLSTILKSSMHFVGIKQCFPSSPNLLSGLWSHPPQGQQK